MTRTWWILTWALESLKNLHFNWFLLFKVYTFWPKKVQKSYLSWYWRVIQNLKKNLWFDLCFGKQHEEFGTFSPEPLKVSKLGLWWDPFVQTRKCMSLKFCRGVILQFLKFKNFDAKFEEKLACHFTNFDQSTQKSKKFLFNGLLWPKYIMFELEKYKAVMYDVTEDRCKIWRETDLCSRKWHKKFGKFSQAEK